MKTASIILFFTLCFAFSESGQAAERVFPSLTSGSLSKKDFNEFRKILTEEHLKNSTETGDQVKTMLIGMLGMESKPEGRKVFSYDLNFNINTLFLVVACANKIKVEKEFIPAYQEQLKFVKSKADSDVSAIATALVEYIILEQGKLP